MTLQLSFGYVLAQFTRFQPDNDKQGRFTMARSFADAFMKYMADDCPAERRGCDHEFTRSHASEDDEESASMPHSKASEASSTADTSLKEN